MSNKLNILSDAIVNNGGFTFNLATQTQPTTGFMVSTLKGCEVVTPLAQFSVDTLVDYFIDHAALLAEPQNCLGAWVDNGLVYLDVSQREEDKLTAVKLAIDNDQLAIFDLSTFETIPTK